jgi:hypothetical protein
LEEPVQLVGFEVHPARIAMAMEKASRLALKPEAELIRLQAAMGGNIWRGWLGPQEIR